jgi:hypothetical protein
MASSGPRALGLDQRGLHRRGARLARPVRLRARQPKVAGILNYRSNEAFMRIAVGLGSEEAKDLAHRFGRSHPSDRMRLAAQSALASSRPTPKRCGARPKQRAAGSSLPKTDS